jgi:hypothetical protein
VTKGRGDDGRILPSSDRLRLDVTMASAVEMYSWVGESRFSDRDLLDIVHEGGDLYRKFCGFSHWNFSHGGRELYVQRRDNKRGPGTC